MLDVVQSLGSGPVSALLQVTQRSHTAILRVQELISGGEGSRRFPGRVGAVSAGDARGLCIGPGDWLFVSETLGPSAVKIRYEINAEHDNLTVTDLTDAFAVIQVVGAQSREVLSKLCGIDFHIDTFPVDRCVRTKLLQVAAIIDCVGGPQRFDVYVSRSYESYLRSVLVDASAEFSTVAG